MTDAAEPTPAIYKPRNRRTRTIINTLIVTFGALGSRVLGLGRDAAILSQFGPPNPYLDTYNTAFSVPDFLYIVVVGGALGSTLIPVFQQVWHDEGEQRAWEVASAVVNLVLIVLAIAALVIVVLATPLSRFLFAAKPADQQQLLAQMMRLFLVSSPFLLGLGGLAMAVLNARERFGWTAAAFNLYNVCIIVGAVWLAPKPQFGIWGVAYGVVAGALLYLLILLPGLHAEHARYLPRLGLRDPAVRRIGRQLGPRLVGQAAAQIGLLATVFFAGRLPGDQYTPLRQANQLMLLPHGVFVISLVTVMFPHMARLWATRDYAAFSTTSLRTIRLVLFVSLPVAVALATLRVPLIRLLYERGDFTAQSTLLVAEPLLWFATALVAFAASEPLVRTFYAMQDTRTPVYVALTTITLNVVASYVVVKFTTWGVAGLAFAFSLANNLEALLLFGLLRSRLQQGAGFGRTMLGGTLSAALMGLALWLFARLSIPFFPMLALDGQYGRGADALRLGLWLAAAGFGGIIVYLGSAALLRVPDVVELRTLLLRGKRQQRAIDEQ